MKLKVIVATGYTPVRALSRVENWKVGDAFGLLPEVAAKAIAAGEVEPVEPPADVETVDWEAGAETLSSPAVGVAAPEKKAAPNIDPGSVEIKDGWRDAHPRTVIALARKIAGATRDVENAADAVAIIEAELARRAAATPSAPTPEAMAANQAGAGPTEPTDPGAAG